jgi:nicotinate-nucleotide--dimethylbenzimidazole phosphoribosyltransferase
MTQTPPIDAVVFAPAALLAGPTERTRRGARRLVEALAGSGVATVAVSADPTLSDRLGRAGFAASVLRVATPEALAGEPTLRPDRTLVVLADGHGPDAPGSGDTAGAPGRGAHGLVPAAPRVSVGAGEGVHEAVLGWLSEPMGPLAAAAALVAPLDRAAVAAAEQRHLVLTKPPGSLGRLEDLGYLLAGIAAEVPPPLPRPAAVAVFAGDHGVHAQGVSPWPQEVTAQMVANFVAGGAAINVLARQAGADVVVVDVGVATALDAAVVAAPGFVDLRVRPGTGDLAAGPAMTPDEAGRALDAGAAVAARLVANGARCLVTGDMGIANTTPSAALVAALTGRPAGEVTGRGTGIDDRLLARKAAIVDAAAARARERHGHDALAVLAEVGGLEHAALAGFIVGAAALQVPVVVDGVAAASALLVASRLVPGVEGCAIAGHRSVEPGASAVLDALDMAPVVDLGLRLGEGTGAALALPLVEAAARVLDEMATFDQAGVADKGA